MTRWLASLRDSGWLVHSARTAVAASGSLAFARMFKIPEPYWAAVTTLVAMQPTLGASWSISKQRFIGTAIGAATGGLMASYFKETALLFGATLFVLGILFAILRLDIVAYRYAGMTLVIVTLVAHDKSPPFVIAFQRFAEVSIGIVVALLFAALWPERKVPGEKS